MDEAMKAGCTKAVDIFNHASPEIALMI
jgi:hypothetical protein